MSDIPKTHASLSPDIAAWPARPSCASCARSATRTFCCAPMQELDLEDSGAVSRFFSEQRPEFVFLAAAKVGGILANRDFPAEFIARNLRIQSNVIESAHRSQVNRLLFLGSSCIYPKLAPQPISRGSTAGRPAGIHQPLLRRGQDRRHRDVLGLQPPIWNALPGRHAHQSLRPGRQLRSGQLPRSARAHPQSA